MLRDSARRFFERECVPHERAGARSSTPTATSGRKAGPAGLLCASIPEEYGGGGGSFLHEAVICEEQMRAMAQGFSNNVHSGIVAHYLCAYGTEEQKRRWLPRMATGELVAAIAMTEPGAGTDLQRIKTQAARREGDQWRISGSKTFITNGMHCRPGLRRRQDRRRRRRQGHFAADGGDRGTAGLSPRPLLDKMGQKTLDTTELFFDDVRVPADNLLGGEKAAASAADAAAAARAHADRRRRGGDHAGALDDTLAYVRDRQVFGQPL